VAIPNRCPASAAAEPLKAGEFVLGYVNELGDV
jgi:hypothetical protein